MDLTYRTCGDVRLSLSTRSLKDAVEGDEGGVRGVITPWVILGGGSLSPGSISALRVTGGPCQR